MTLHYPAEHFSTLPSIGIARLALLSATLAVMLAVYILAAADRSPVAVGSIEISAPASVETVFLVP